MGQFPNTAGPGIEAPEPERLYSCPGSTVNLVPVLGREGRVHPVEKRCLFPRQSYIVGGAWPTDFFP